MEVNDPPHSSNPLRKQEAKNEAVDFPNQAPAVIKDPPFQSILEWNFAKWPKVTEKLEPVDPKYWELCIPYGLDAMGRVPDSKLKLGPHEFGLIQVRVNEIGLKALQTGMPLPVGSVVIKEKHDIRANSFFAEQLARPSAVAAMVKRERGYDPEFGDWEYVYQVNLPISEHKVTRGKIASCIGCHQTVRDQDFLYRKHLAKIR